MERFGLGEVVVERVARVQPGERKSLITWKFLTVLTLFIVINIFIDHAIPMNIFKLVYGMEWVFIALLMFIFWKWTAEFIRINLINYPFLRNVIPKNLVVRRWFVVLLAICVSLFGLLVIFGPTTRVVTQSPSNVGSH
jgi:hypothetical protein